MLTVVRFSIGLMLLPSMMIFGMENTGTREKKYTVGLKISNETFAGQKVNPVHMTITYLGAADEIKLEKAKRFLAIINQLRPIKVKIGAMDIFGTQERPVQVRRLIIERHEIEEQLVIMHRELGECEPFQPKKLDIPNWHIVVKDPKLQAELSDKADKLVILTGGKLFIKPLGNFDPIVEFE